VVSTTRRRFASRCVVAVAVACGVTGPEAARGSGGADSRIVATNAVIEGRTYHEWTAAWWQWIVSFAPDINPAFDTTGEYADEGQTGAVYFLAGTFGGEATRTITVPYGKYFLLPVVTSEWDTTPGIPNPLNLPDPLSVHDLRRITHYQTNGATGSCWINGVRVANLSKYRARSPVFSMNFDPEFQEAAEYPAAYVRTAVSDGYWLILKPLPVGRHTIRFKAQNNESGFRLDVTYNITIISNLPARLR
jgi:hypothetical protein